MKQPNLFIFTGAGMSAESGIETFRGSGGLWEGFDVMEVASIDGYKQNPELVLQFYNQRRAQLAKVEPNKGHYLLAELEKQFNITIATQNVDDLHERAGSSKVIHLHGELTKACSSVDKSNVQTIGYEPIEMHHKAADGSPLRPFIVWFGEEVPLMQTAYELLHQADAFVVIGTSLQVYPAASLIFDIPPKIPKFLIDPNEKNKPSVANFNFIHKSASEGVETLKNHLNKYFDI